MLEELLSMNFDLTIDWAYWTIKSYELLILAIVTFVALKTIPLIPQKIDDMIKRWDLKESIHHRIQLIIRAIIKLVAIAFGFSTVGVNPVSNQFYELIVLFYVTKVVLSIVKPAFRKLDKKINAVDFSEQTHKLVEQAITYIVYTAAFIIALGILGYTEIFAAALAGAGIFGIAIGFAAKDTFSNMISGFFMIFDKPLKMNDVVEINGQIGVVDDLGFRLTKLRTFDNKSVIIPNSLISSTVVVNYSKKSFRRGEVVVGIAYESDVDKAIKIMKKIASKLDGVITDNDKKPIQVIVQDLADFSVNLSLRFWVDVRKGSPFIAQSEARKQILKEFDKAGIEIPYPKRVMVKDKVPRKKKK